MLTKLTSWTMLTLTQSSASKLSVHSLMVLQKEYKQNLYMKLLEKYLELIALKKTYLYCQQPMRYHGKGEPYLGSKTSPR